MEQKSISWETAEHIKKIITYIFHNSYNYLSGEWSKEDLKEYVENWFSAYCRAEGITNIKLPSNTKI